MGAEDHSLANFPSRPASSPFLSSHPVVRLEASPLQPPQQPAPQTTTPFLSTGPVIGSDAVSPFRLSFPPASQTTALRPGFGSEVSGFRSMPQGRPTAPPSIDPSSPSYGPPAGGPSQHFSEPQFSSMTQVLPPPLGQPAFPPPTNHPGGHVPSMSAFRNPQPQIPSVPPQPNFQQSSARTGPSYPPVTHQGGYVPPPPGPSTPFLSHQGGFSAPPQMRPLGPTPPMGPAQGLIEDFESLSLGSAPGSFDPGLESNALPRPLDSDMEAGVYADKYPMNCDSRYLRLTTSAIPNSQSLSSRWHLPLGAVVCPLAEAPIGEEVPIVDFYRKEIIRRRRCSTYVNPYVTFLDGGRKWQCNICPFLNEVPGHYFAPLDASGRRIDLDHRPELIKGSVEFVVPKEYMGRPPMPPLYFFLIDVSISAVRSGMLEEVAQTIKSCLDKLPGSTRTQIGFITYDSAIHFYNMKSSLTQPQMMVVSDLDDTFIPLPDDLLVNLSESRSVVEAFLDSLPSMFQDNVNVESTFGPALNATFMIMSQLGGKLLIFQNTRPSLGVGRLSLRGDHLHVYGTDKEHTLRTAEDPFYKQIAAKFTKYQIAVNIYAFSDKYMDIASLGTLAKYTGGQVYYYPGFQAGMHGERLRHELARDLTRETAWESVMRVRCGRGVRFITFHGNFMQRSSDLLALPAVDSDKAFAMQLSLEETLLTCPTVYFQAALLYTASSGERRVRVHTAVAPVVADLGEMYRQADTGAIVTLLSRLAIEKSLSCKLQEARNFIQERIVKGLREHRKLYTVQHRLGNRMIYPETLKYLSLYGLALCKLTPLRGGYADVQLDERCAAGFTIMALPVKKLLKLVYPNLIRIDECLLKAGEFENVYKRLPLAADSLDSRGVYVYDDGFRFVIWFGRMLSPDIATNLLGEDFDRDLWKVGQRGNEMSRKLMGMLEKFREADPSYYQLCHLVREGEQPTEGFLLLANLVEDQVGCMSDYLDWILQIHRQTQKNA